MKNVGLVFIGNGGKMLGCGEVALSAGFRILAVCSADPEVQQWFARHNVASCGSVSELEAMLGGDTPSTMILFSLDNPQKIAENLLHRFRYAINCHNSLLPHYGGIHPVSWALLQGETKVGITFHLMDKDFDTGPIVLQKEYEIHATEPDALLEKTNQVLDQLAIMAFREELLPHLKSVETLTPIRQSGDASYYGIDRCWPQYGFIDVMQSQAEVVRFISALPKPPMLNWLGVPKIFHGGVPYIISRVAVQTAFASQAICPGRILAVNQNGLIIQVADGAIEVSLLSIDGRAIADFHALFAENDTLTLPDADIRDKLAARHKANWQAERALQKRFPFPLLAPEQSLPEIERESGNAEVFSREFGLPDGLIQRLSRAKHFSWQIDTSKLITAVILYYLGRFNGYEDFSLVYQPPQHASSVAEGTGFYYLSHHYLAVSIDPAASFADFYANIAKQLASPTTATAVSHDVFYRYPNLAFLRDLSIAIVVRSRWSEPTGRSSATSQRSLWPITFVVEENRIVLEVQGMAAARHDRITVLFARLQHILSALANVENFSEKPCSQLPLMDEADFHDILKAGNFTHTVAAEVNTDARSELIERITPNINERKERRQFALVSIEECSYANLHEKADRFCQYLLGMLPEKNGVIAICLDNSALTVILVIAAMKLGCAVLPLNPRETKEKLALILQATTPDIVLTYAHAATKMPPSHEGKIILLTPDSIAEIYVSQEGEDMAVTDADIEKRRSASAGNDLLLISTSGTTGDQPKVVRVQPQAFLNSMTTRLAQYKDTANAEMRLALLMAPTFDTWFAAVFWALMRRGTLFLLPGHVLRSTSPNNVRSIVDLIQKEDITDVICVPALYQRVLDSATKPLSTLTRVIVGGDTLSPTLLSRHKLMANCACLFIEYGLTEAAVFSTSHTVVQPGQLDAPIAIGLPLGGNKLVLLDDYDQPVPPGHSGIAAIAGDQVSPAYLSAAEPEQHRFRQITVGNHMLPAFVSSDVMTYDPANRVFMFRGRNDFLVKVGGVFVNTDEIIDALKRHSAVKDAIVIMTKDKELAAFVVPKDLEATLTHTHVIKFLRDHLPSHMLPNKIIFKTALPLTYHHKIDRMALLGETEMLKQRGTDNNYVEPITPIESYLTRSWATILGYDQIGVEDNFLDLGATSLQIIDMLTKIYLRYGVSIKPEFIYAQPTLRALSIKITERSPAIPEVSMQLPEALRQDLMRVQASPGLPVTQPSAVSSVSAKNILLLGATGYIGCHVLARLLQAYNPEQRIYCLIRLKSVNRFQQLRDNSGLSEVWGQRVKLIVGDITEADFGTHGEHYKLLCDSIDLIINCVGEVSHSLPYSCLRAANINTVDKVIKLASVRQAAIIHVSTLSCTLSGSDKKITEALPTLPLDAVREQQLARLDPYNQSKFMAECALAKARELGLTVAVVRPAWILLAERSVFNISVQRQDFVSALLAGCAQVNAVPQLGKIYIDGMPVDQMAAVIAQIVQIIESQQITGLTVYNLRNPHPSPWHEVASQALGGDEGIRWLSYADWRTKIADAGEHNALYPYQLMLSARPPEGGGDLLTLINPYVPAADNRYEVCCEQANSVFEEKQYKYSAYLELIDAVVKETGVHTLLCAK